MNKIINIILGLILFILYIPYGYASTSGNQLQGVQPSINNAASQQNLLLVRRGDRSGSHRGGARRGGGHRGSVHRGSRHRGSIHRGHYRTYRSIHRSPYRAHRRVYRHRGYHRGLRHRSYYRYGRYPYYRSGRYYRYSRRYRYGRYYRRYPYYRYGSYHRYPYRYRHYYPYYPSFRFAGRHWYWYTGIVPAGAAILYYSKFGNPIYSCLGILRGKRYKGRMRAEGPCYINYRGKTRAVYQYYVLTR